MTWQTPTGRRGLLAAAACMAIIALGAGSHLIMAVFDAAAQDAASPDGTSETPKPKKRRVVHKTPAKPAESESAAATAPAPGAPAAPAPAPIDFAAQLDKAGAAACHGLVNALATSTMGSVVAYNTMSNWSEVASGKHAVSVAIGQKYADGSAVPFSVSQVVSAPNQQGSCDGFSVQVIPSPLPCGKLRETMSTRGKQIGDLAGIPLMQDAAGRTMLVPTSANTCVLVATRAVYPR